MSAAKNPNAAASTVTKPTTEQQANKKAIADLQNLALEALKTKYPNFPYPPKQKYTDKTANGLTKCIIDYVTLKGFQAERINSTGRQIKTGNAYKWIKNSGTNGTADISATIHGRSVKIEVKCKATGDTRQSQEQKDYQAKIETAGGIYVIAYTFAQFYEWFNSKRW